VTKAARILADLVYPDAKWKLPCLIATFGFPGAGKTTVASTLSNHYPFVLLTTDLIRLKYGFTSGPETLKTMCLVGEKLLSQSYSVIFDGIHMMRKNREEIRHLGIANKAKVRFVHVFADPNVIKQRLNQRIANPDATRQNGKFVITDEHFQRIISYYEKPNGEKDVIEVDTSLSSSPTANQLSSLYVELDRWVGER
jgi:predicted kinase